MTVSLWSCASRADLLWDNSIILVLRLCKFRSCPPCLRHETGTAPSKDTATPHQKLSSLAPPPHRLQSQRFHSGAGDLLFLPLCANTNSSSTSWRVSRECCTPVSATICQFACSSTKPGAATDSRNSIGFTASSTLNHSSMSAAQSRERRRLSTGRGNDELH